MKTKFFTFFTLTFLISASLFAQTISTIAGNGTNGYAGDGGPAINALLDHPNQIIYDAMGNLFIADDYNNVVRKISASGIISTVAGTGISGFSGDGGLAINAELNRATGVTVDAVGNIYICDADNYRIRKVDTAGIIHTIAGNGIDGHSGDGGLATAASIGFISGILVDGLGNIYLASQTDAYGVRKIDTAGIISSIVGNGNVGFSGDGGLAINAQVNSISAIYLDAVGNLYCSDFGGMRIRKVNTLGIISTIAGNGNFGSSGDGGPATSATLFYPYGITMDAIGNLYFCDAANSKVRKIDTLGIISTFAGVGGFTGGYGGDGGLAINASLNNPSAICIDPTGNIIIGDYANNAIRKVAMGISTGILEGKSTNKNFAVYPNPSNGNFTLMTNKIGTYYLTNSVGTNIKTITATTNNQQVNIGDIAAGIYFVKGEQGVEKIIVTK